MAEVPRSVRRICYLRRLAAVPPRGSRPEFRTRKFPIAVRQQIRELGSAGPRPRWRYLPEAALAVARGEPIRSPLHAREATPTRRTNPLRAPVCSLPRASVAAAPRKKFALAPVPPWAWQLLPAPPRRLPTGTRRARRELQGLAPA